jgi:hypothetical protein
MKGAHFRFPGLLAFETGAEKMAENRAGLKTKGRPYKFDGATAI